MELNMSPMGKPKPGCEKRFMELYEILFKGNYPKPTFWDRLFGRKHPPFNKLLDEMHKIQISPFETVKAPLMGRDKEANELAKEIYHKKFDNSEKKPTFKEFLKSMKEYYVMSLAKELDGVPVYYSREWDRLSFRGKIFRDCADLIGEDLVNEAWETKTADETLDYGNRLMAVAEAIAKEYDMEYLKDQRMPPGKDDEEPSEATDPSEGTADLSVEEQLHVVFSLAKWLIFYGKNGHGYLTGC